MNTAPNQKWILILSKSHLSDISIIKVLTA